jgi:hypothetical protein
LVEREIFGLKRININWMLQTDLFWLKKNSKSTFLGKIPKKKSKKNPTQKKFFFQLNQLSRVFRLLNTLKK